MAHFEPLIDRIYEAGLIPSLWPALLGELGTAVGGDGGFLFGVRDGYTSAVNSVEYDALMPLFARRDEIITLLSRNDPASADRLSDVFASYTKSMTP